MSDTSGTNKFSTIENIITNISNLVTGTINDNSSSNSNNNERSFDDLVLGLFDESANTTGFDPQSSGNITNGTGNGTSQEVICVMCRYYLQPWLKALRVGFGSIIVLANIATLIMLLRARTLQLALRLFLLNVAVVDCGYGAGFLYHSAIVDFPQFVIMNFECKLRYGGLCMVSMVALFTLMAMCVERVIALKFAFTYHLLITRRNLLIGIVIFWAVPAAIVTPTYILMDSSVGECNFVRFISAESFVVFSVTYFMLMVVAVFCQLFLLYIAKVHIKKILPTIVGDQKKKASFKMNLKATSTTLSLAVPFVICAAPKVLTYMFLAFNPRERIKVESLTLLAVTVYLNVSNSLINPIVYCYRLPELRAQIMAIFGRRMTPFKGSSEEPIKPHSSSSSSSKLRGGEDRTGKANNSAGKLNKTGSRMDAIWITDDMKDVVDGIKSQVEEGGNSAVKVDFDTQPSRECGHCHLGAEIEEQGEIIDGIRKTKFSVQEDIACTSDRESPIRNGSEIIAAFPRNSNDPQCSLGVDSELDMEGDFSLQRKGGKKLDRDQRHSEQKSAGGDDCLIDPARLASSSRQRSDCSAKRNVRFHQGPYMAKDRNNDHCELRLSFEDCQCEPSEIEKFEAALQPTSTFEEGGIWSETNTDSHFSLQKCESELNLKFEGLEEKPFETKPSFEQHASDSPKRKGRASPDGGTSPEKNHVTFCNDHNVREPSQEVDQRAPPHGASKISSFKHIWKAWALSILTEAAKNLLYGLDDQDIKTSLTEKKKCADKSRVDAQIKSPSTELPARLQQPPSTRPEDAGNPETQIDRKLVFSKQRATTLDNSCHLARHELSRTKDLSKQPRRIKSLDRWVNDVKDEEEEEKKQKMKRSDRQPTGAQRSGLSTDIGAENETTPSSMVARLHCI